MKMLTRYALPLVLAVGAAAVLGLVGGFDDGSPTVVAMVGAASGVLITLITLRLAHHLKEPSPPRPGLPPVEPRKPRMMRLKKKD